VRRRGGRGREQDALSNRILIAAVGGLLLLTVIVVSYLALAPRAQPTSEGAPDSQTADSAPAPSPAITNPVPETTQTATPNQESALPHVTTPAAVNPPVAADTPQPTLPEQMKRMLPGSTQIIVVTGKKLGSNTGTVYVFNKEGDRWVEKLKTTTRMGTNGLTNGETRRSGNRTTPTGIWSIGKFLFGKAPSPPKGTMMPYRQIKSNSYWSGEHDSTYNTWVNHKVVGEHLITAANLQYEFVLDSAYNEPPNKRVIGRGTAIFLHVEDPPSYHNGFTAGCVGIPREDMITVFKLIDPKRKPSFAIGTLQKGTSTSIYSY
jgi:L,D-peptidoglycan transpeptidase YkuD (ErfK/YbiS/YcfS/YnhG family)